MNKKTSKIQPSKRLETNKSHPQVSTPALPRWRLILGQFAEQHLQGALQGQTGYSRMDLMLDYLYGREYQRRGIRQGSKSDPGKREGGHGASSFTIPDWIHEIRDLFPTDTCEVITNHALHRYQLTEIVTDKKTLAALEPNYDLLKTLLTFKGLMKGEVLQLARRIIAQVVEDLRKKLEASVRPILWGRVDRNRRTRFQNARSLDIHRTIRKNLKYFNQESHQILAQDLYFRGRTQRHLPFHIILAVDCSGSMLDSVIYSAVMAGIFKALPSVCIKLLAFDTSVVDLSDEIDDPVELLMSVQLGGGTHIAGALETCASLVTQPTRTIIILVTDFFEGGSALPLQHTIHQLKSEGVRVLGLAALDQNANPSYDREIAEACAQAGAEIAAMTPQHLAQWVAQVLS